MSSEKPVYILLIEDESAHAELIERAFEERPDFCLTIATNLEAAQKYLALDTPLLPALIISDWLLPDGNGLDLLQLVQVRKQIPVIIMTSYGNERVAVEALKNGASDYVVKSIEILSDMPHIAERVLRQWHTRIEHERTEKALHESELRLRTITDNMLDIICQSDADGICQYISPSCEVVLGYKAEEIVGRNLFDFVYVEDEATATQAARNIWRKHQSTRTAYRYLHANGSYIWLEVIGRPLLNAQGHIESVIFMGRDVSERKQTEEKLRKAQEDLRHAQKMEAIGRLAGGVAHDFNNLLTVISVCSELILNSFEDDEPLKETAGEVLKSAERAAALTRQLLLFSRQQVLTPRILDLNMIVVDMEKLLRRLIRESIEFVLDLQLDLAPIKADAGQLEQVIMNLAVNARDAMLDGGKLLIETKNIEVDEVMAAQTLDLKVGFYVLLSVTDTGVGISAENILQIFEPYFTTKEQGKGTGLGLAMVYGIVKQSGGHIGVYSEIGHGTTFKIYLPVASANPSVEKQHNPVKRLNTNTATILVVEDDEVLLQITSRILQEQGYCVLQALRAEQAITIVQNYKGTIHLLLTDVVMPIMNGQELAEQLMQMKPELKVLYVSGYTDNPIFLQKMLHSAVENYLQKPYNINQLLNKVSEILAV